MVDTKKISKSNTRKLTEILLMSGKKRIGPAQYHKIKKQKYRYVEYYINKPFPWVVQIFQRASKENKGEFRRFDNGIKDNGRISYHCSMGTMKNEPAGILLMKILEFL